MNWIQILFSAMAGACLIVGVVHLCIWLHQRSQVSQLFFSIAAVAVAAIALIELYLIRAPDAHHYSQGMRLIHVFISIFIPCILGFIWLDLRAGWKALAIAAVTLRLAMLPGNFLSGENTSFLRITELRMMEGWGRQSFVVPIGDVNPLLFVGQLSNVLLLIFIATVMVDVMRGGDAVRRRRAILTCGSVILCLIGSSTMMLLIVSGASPIPLALNLSILPVIAAMGYLLGGDVIRASALSTQLLGSQQQLRESQERMQLATSAADIGLWSWNSEGDSYWFSPIGESLLGIPKGQPVSSKSFIAMVHPEDHEAVLRAHDEATHRSGDFVAEYRRLLPNGRVRWVSARGRADRERSDAPLLVRGVMVDITERREAEDRLRHVVDGAPIGMMVCRPDGRIVLTNLQADRVFGYSHAEILGLTIDQMMPALVLSQGLAGAASQDTPTGESAPLRELLGRHRSGSDMPLEVSIAPIAINQVPHALVSVTDVSGRKRMEHQHSQQREELAHLSRIALLGEISGSLAHELNQPLTAVLSNAQAALRFLAHEPPNLGEVRESLVHIVENDKRASEVIRRLRAMLRKEALDYRVLSVNDVIEDVIRLIRSDLLNRRVSLQLDLAEVLPAVNGDRVQLQQVMLNLAINACDAMRDLDRDRVLTFRSRAASGTAVEVLVSDVGPGIDTEDLERIFTPFVTSKSDGIGLGLSICRTIVQAHRGQLWASNNEGHGATLHFTLPTLNDARLPA